MSVVKFYSLWPQSEEDFFLIKIGGLCQLIIVSRSMCAVDLIKVVLFHVCPIQCDNI